MHCTAQRIAIYPGVLTRIDRALDGADFAGDTTLRIQSPVKSRGMQSTAPGMGAATDSAREERSRSAPVVRNGSAIQAGMRRGTGPSGRRVGRWSAGVDPCAIRRVVCGNREQNSPSRGRKDRTSRDDPSHGILRSNSDAQRARRTPSRSGTADRRGRRTALLKAGPLAFPRARSAVDPTAAVRGNVGDTPRVCDSCSRRNNEFSRTPSAKCARTSGE
jgi:hypothetical protein